MDNNLDAVPASAPHSDGESVGQRLNIIIFSTSSTLSGGARQALYLAEGFHKKGFCVRFVCPPACELAQMALSMGLVWVALPGKFFEAERMLRGLFDKERPTVLHAFHNKGVKWAAYMGAWWRLRRLPVICVAHRGVTSRPGNPLPWLLPGIRAWLVNSRACARSLSLHLLWRRKRCFVVNNSISEERLLPARSKAEILSGLGIPPGHLVVGDVCNDNPAKGAGRLIKAFAQARPSLPPASLLLVGVSPEAWAPLCKELGVAEQVRLIPPTNAVSDYLQCMDLFVFPSTFIESQPNVIIEAMCMGLPVIGGTAGGVPELLPADCLFDPVNEKALLEKLLHFAASPQERERLALRNLRRKPEFSLDYRLETVLRHYKNCLREAGLLL